MRTVQPLRLSHAMARHEEACTQMVMQTLRIGGTERTYLVHAPEGYTGKTPIPLVVCLHGAGGSAQGTMQDYRWDKKADSEHFLIVCPEGLPVFPDKPATFLRNPRLWNDGSPRGTTGNADRQDVAFLNQALDRLGDEYNLDMRRIYMTGFSNGAGMAFRAAVELSHRVAAIAAVAGRLWLTAEPLEQPVPLLYLIGEEDPLIPLQGGEIRSPWTRQIETRPPVQATVDRWAALLGLSTVPDHVTEIDGVTKRVYGSGLEDREIDFYTIAGQGHFWPGGIINLPRSIAGRETHRLNATDTIWTFFQNHSKHNASAFI